MPDYPFVTLIIPTLNEENFIRQCLWSAYKQSYPVDLTEILIVDGGSTDKTLSVAKDEQAEHPNVTILKNNKRIQSSAFNLGVSCSKGSIIIRWDAHCSYDPDYIHFCVLNHIEGDYGNVGGSIKVLPGSQTLMSSNIALINSSAFGLGGAPFRRKSERAFVDTVPFGAFRKEVIKEIGPMNDQLPRGEDNEYNSRIKKAGYKILLDPRIKSSYFARKDLKSFLRQMYTNGFSVGVLLIISASHVGKRHIVPLLFLLFLFSGLLVSFVSPLLISVFIVILAAYSILNLVYAFKACVGKDIRIIPLMFYSVFLVHVCYGWGTLIGIFTGRFKVDESNA
jgi:glycosyltransferase involved in cell wall biosynthesis